MPTLIVEPIELAGSTGLEPAASAVTGQRSNQLNYDPPKDKFEVQSTKFEVTSFLRLLCTYLLLWVPTSYVPLLLRTLYFKLPTFRSGRYRIRTCDSRRVKPVLYH